MGVEENDVGGLVLMRVSGPIKQQVRIGYVEGELHRAVAHFGAGPPARVVALGYLKRAMRKRKKLARYVQLGGKGTHKAVVDEDEAPKLSSSI